ncbi:MAG: Transport permease protein [Chloroflexota bacterium]|nr:Transport permease protein [Chloroflexota bacterium]
MNEKTTVSADSLADPVRVGAEASSTISIDENAASPAWIRPRRSMLAHILELWRYRDLIRNLVVRDLKARYKNNVLGFLWSLLNPLGMMVVFMFVFTVMMPSQVARFSTFLLCGLLPWNFFSAGVMVGITSITGNANLVKKVYFPREALTISSVLANLVNFLLGLIVLFVVLLVSQSPLSPWLWLLPVVILIETCFVLGVALVLSTLNVFYRDTIMIMDVVMLAWFFLTPVVYPITTLPSNYQFLGLTVDVHRWMYILNPMASLIAAYRDLLYWGYRTDLDFLARTAVTALAVLAFGYWFFVRFRDRFGEEV